MKIGNEANQFYPTPKELVKRILEGCDLKNIQTVLEPSAGSGNIIEALEEYEVEYDKNLHLRHNISVEGKKWISIDCIELDKDLRSALIGKGFRVIQDDFLTFNSFKRYDLIIMNPPFNNGAKHLLKALELQQYGGNIICILNAETIKNLCTNERKMLQRKLEEYNATIEFMEEAFGEAERKTNVEIAVVKVCVPEKTHSSFIYSDLKQRYFREEAIKDITSLAENDFVKTIVAEYNKEVELGIGLIREYKSLLPHLKDSLKTGGTALRLTLGKDTPLTENEYVRTVREKYWYALFNNEHFTGSMTTAQKESYRNRCKDLCNYDFSYYNIKTIQEEMCKGIVKGIEECIITLFDELSRQYAWSSETDNNIHYYNGWATNKSWYINQKVILPFMNAWSSTFGKYEPYSSNYNHKITNKLTDIEKALDYLDGGLTDGTSVSNIIKQAEESGQTKNIECKHFTITFYKKGTMHLTFKNPELLKKLNIFGSQQKAWLPPSYGKKAYEDMEAAERAVIDEFEGKEEYTKTLLNKDYYIYSPKNAILEIGEKNIA